MKCPINDGIEETVEHTKAKYAIQKHRRDFLRIGRENDDHRHDIVRNPAHQECSHNIQGHMKRSPRGSSHLFLSSLFCLAEV